MENLRKAGAALNASVINAIKLGLGDNVSTAAAVATFDKIQYTRQARAALQEAITRGREVLSSIEVRSLIGNVKQF